MKIFKGLLVIIVLCASNSMFAKIVTKGTQKQTPVQEEKPTTLSQQTYAAILNKIRTGNTGGVTIVDANNKLTDEFINFVLKNARDAYLSDFDIQALLQAGANLNVKWSGNAEKDNNILLTLNSQIKNVEPLLLSIPDFYDPISNMLKEEYLNQEIQKFSQHITSDRDIRNIILNQNLDTMQKMWALDNVAADVNTLTNALKDQINEATIERKALPQPTQPTKPAKKPLPQPKPKPKPTTKPVDVPAPTDLPPVLVLPETKEPAAFSINDLIDQNEQNVRLAYKSNNGDLDTALTILGRTGIVQAVKKNDPSDNAKKRLSDILADRMGQYIVPNITSAAAVNTLWNESK
jgi:hypothetical protein